MSCCVLGGREDWSVVSQRVHVDVDLQQRVVTGKTELLVLYRGGSEPPSTLRLDCSTRFVSILSVEVAGSDVSFTQEELPLPEQKPADEVLLESDTDIITDARDLGQLVISLPSLPESRIPNSELPEPISVVIDFSVASEGGALCFSQPDYPSPHLFTAPYIGRTATWLPCRDSLWERSHFQLQISCHASLSAAASGELIEHRFTNSSKTKHTSVFRSQGLVTASSVGFAVGELANVPHPSLPLTVYSIDAGRRHGYRRDDNALLHSVYGLDTAMTIFSEFLGQSCPFSTLRIVFVDMPETSTISLGSLLLLSADLVHPNTVIEQPFVTRTLVGETLARSWVRQVVRVKCVADWWICEGLSGVLGHLLDAELFGKNEAKYRRDAYMKQVVGLSQRPDALPLHTELYGDAIELFGSTLFRRKSTLVMLMLRDKLGLEVFQDLVHHMLAVVAGSATEDPAYVSLSSFFRFVKRRSVHSFDDFRDRWIFGSDCPAFVGSAVFHRKKNVCDVKIGPRKGSGSAAASTGSIQFFIHEIDRQVYKEDVRLEEGNKLIDCHTKVRKKREKLVKGKRGKNVIRDEDPDDDEEDSPSRSSATPKVFKHAMDNEELMASVSKNDTPVRWVRVDPTREWIRTVSFRQLPLWGIQALRNSHDACAQLEAVDGLAKTLDDAVHKSLDVTKLGKSANDKELATLIAVINCLKECIECSDYFYRVRVAAIGKLANAPNYPYLIDLYKSKCFDSKSGIPQPNDFSNFAEYFVHKSIPTALSRVRDDSGSSPSDIISFLESLLNHNDNSHNFYSDSCFLGSILLSLGNLRPPSQPLVDSIWELLHKFLASDSNSVSYNRIITQSCLHAMASLSLEFPPSSPKSSSARLPQVPVDLVRFACNSALSSQLRETAFSCLVTLACAGMTEAFPVLLDILDEVQTQSCRAGFSELLADSCMVTQSKVSPVYQEAIDLKQRVFEMNFHASAVEDCRFRYAMTRVYLCIWGTGQEATVDRRASSCSNSRRRARALMDPPSSKKQKQ